MAVVTISAPSSAKEKESVPVTVKVTNSLGHNASFKIVIYAVPDKYPNIPSRSINTYIINGATKTFSSSFIMPDCRTTAFVAVEYFSVSDWTYYSVASDVVSLEEPEPAPEPAPGPVPDSQFRNLAVSVR